MICNKNYSADILRVCEIKNLIWVMRFQSPEVYTAAFQFFMDSDFCHNYLHALYLFECL